MQWCHCHHLLDEKMRIRCAELRMKSPCTEWIACFKPVSRLLVKFDAARTRDLHLSLSPFFLERRRVLF